MNQIDEMATSTAVQAWLDLLVGQDEDPLVVSAWSGLQCTRLV